MPGYPTHPQPRRKPKPPARDTERHTLVKYLVAAGLGSRRHCAALVMAGYVTVNDETADSLMMEVSHRDRIEVDGRPVQAKRGAHVYLAANKPDNYLSAVSDDRERQTVLELVPRALRVNGLVPAGRLDLHSTGLILLTNDGELVNRITHPRHEVEKEYHVSLDRVVQPAQSSQLRSGVEIEGGTAHAKALRRLQDEPGYQYSITLVEGKKREVRLMFREVGRRVLALQRVRIGTLELGTLAEGEVRELTDREVSDLKRLVGIYAPRPAEAERPARAGQPTPRPARGRPSGDERRERPSTAPRSGRTGGMGRSGRTEGAAPRSGRAERTARPRRAEESDRPQRAEGTDRPRRAEGSDRPRRTGQDGPPSPRPKPERPFDERRERPSTAPRSRRTEGSDRSAKKRAPARPARTEGAASRSGRAQGNAPKRGQPRKAAPPARRARRG